MPETGPRAPARTLVAVRAMVPVTQMPPNSAEPMLATPCATSSQFERWRRPVMPSATTADSSDSMAPSSAKATASGSTAMHLVELNAGSGGQRQRARDAAEARADGLHRQADSTAPRPSRRRPRSACPASVGRKRLRPRIERDGQHRDAQRPTRLIVPAAPPPAPSASAASGPGSLPGQRQAEQVAAAGWRR